MQMRHSVDADIGFWINHDLAVFNRSYDNRLFYRGL
jgi:hypothetical protein